MADREHSLGLHGIVSAVAPRVAPEQAPRREHRAPKYAVLADRFDRVARARRLVLAAPRNRRRDQRAGRRRSARPRPPCGARSASPKRAAPRARRPLRRRPRSRSSPSRRSPRWLGARSAARSRSPAFAISSSQRRVDPGQPLALDELARPTGARRRRRPGPCRRPAFGARERLAQQPLDAVALDRAADLARDRQAQPRPRRPPGSGTCTARGAGSPSSDPAGRRARTPRCATGDRDLTTRGFIAQPSPSG